METSKAESFEHEALRFALDQDSLQNLALQAANEWHLAPEHVIEAAKRLVGAGLLRLYREGGADVDVTTLDATGLQSSTTIWLEPTEKTAPELNKIATTARP